jgi:tetratricopeptide (TPR) repeat protein
MNLLSRGSWAVALALVLGTGAAAAQPQVPSDEALRAQARPGLERLMDGDLEGAIRVFREIQKADAQSPLGDLLEADALWWRIYYSTANLVDPDVFITTDHPTSPLDAAFEALLDAAIAKSEARIKAHQEVARSHLYEGMAYGLRGRLAALRNRGLPTARAGKKMRSLLLEALQLDPNLADAYAGTGNYNYFVDTLSAIVRLLGFLIGLPGGDRAEGLKQLELAAQKGDLTRAEARFYLAKNLSRPSERQPERSLQHFQELEREYPHNPLWPMMVASLDCRMGHTGPCETGYRSVLQRTAHPKNEVDAALYRAARYALQRRHPNEKIDSVNQ